MTWLSARFSVFDCISITNTNFENMKASRFEYDTTSMLRKVSTSDKKFLDSLFAGAVVLKTQC